MDLDMGHGFRYGAAKECGSSCISVAMPLG